MNIVNSCNKSLGKISKWSFYMLFTLSLVGNICIGYSFYDALPNCTNSISKNERHFLYEMNCQHKLRYLDGSQIIDTTIRKYTLFPLYHYSSHLLKTLPFHDYPLRYTPYTLDSFHFIYISVFLLSIRYLICIIFPCGIVLAKALGTKLGEKLHAKN